MKQTCGVGVSFGFTPSRLVYSFGALLNTIGVGSELYDFSGCASNVGINNGGGMFGGGTFNMGGWLIVGGLMIVGCCCIFC